ncbi:MAG: SDR family NAD(P)-dependent oxidoreductase [Myxococcota bacterium]|nr:SDR family NAD(P)-dependent oxidoreductase [Myxococcota bacterium]
MSTVREPLAVVGVSAIFPGSVDRYGFWHDILQGQDLISDVPESHWLIEDYYDADLNAPDKTYGKRGGFLSDVDFDPLSWGVPPSIMPATDTTQLLALIVAKRCLDDACQGDFSHIDRDRVSVILGATSSQELLNNMVARLQRPVWVKSLREHGIPESEVEQICARISDHYVPWQESTFPGLLGNVIAGRIANRLDLGGTNCVTDAACASTLSAVSMGVSELYLGDSDLVLVGGADTMNDIFMHMCFSKTPALSKTGDVRPFSNQADGTLLGEGIGMFALRRLSDAEKSGDPIYAVLAGMGSSSDGRAKSVYAPRADGQAKAIRRAYAHAGIDARSVELIEAHGTGTKAGDAAEFGGLKAVFEEADPESKQWCALGSVKSQIGHTKAAAGAAGMFKAVLALHHGVFPPTIKVDAPNPNLDLEKSPLYINTKLRPWVHSNQSPRCAGVSALGFGGSNFHVALKEYQGPNKAKLFRNWDCELLVWSADSVDALKDQLTTVQSSLGDKPLTQLAKQTAEEQNAGHHRLAIVATSLVDLEQKLSLAASKLNDGDFSTPDGVYYRTAPLEGKLAFLFPGQGSQHLNMGAELVMAHPAARDAWDAQAHLKYDGTAVHDVVFPIPTFDSDSANAQTKRLTQTEWAQPAIGLASLATLRMFNELGVKPDAVAGHSYGELSALHASGVFSTEDFVAVSRKRGELMRDASVLPGAMSAVKAPRKKIQPLLDSCGLPVVIANHNSPKQSVISGPSDAVEQVETLLKEAGMLSQRLNVATAFHSSVVSDSVAPFQDFLKGVKVSAPKIPVYANSTAEPYPKSSQKIRSILSGQIASSVRYVELIERMANDGVRCFVEVGPHQIQTGLVKQILRRRKDCMAISSCRKGKSALSSFLNSVAQLYTLGHSVSFEALYAHHLLPFEQASSEPSKMAIPINGTNYGKPYPPKGGAAALPKPNPPKPVEDVMAKSKPSPPAHAASSAAPRTPNTTNSVATSPSVSAPVPTAPPQTVPVQGVSQAWLHAFQQAQQQTAMAHTAYQNAMAQAHTAYLQTMQASLQGLAQLAGTGTVATPAQFQPAVAPGVAPPAFHAPPQQPVMTTQPLEPSAPVYTAQPISVPKPVLSEPSPTGSVVQAPSSKGAVNVSKTNIHALLLTVVSEKTGYPTDALSMEMSLEGDLGIDSIKRVEILSAVQERAPDLPEVDAGAMAQLQTLGQILAYLDDSSSESSSGETTTEPQASSKIDSLLLSVVSEKTGYPTDALSLEMSLEGDLGIDSIKRVEILSAVQERAPDLPEVDAGAMAQLQTLGQILDYLSPEALLQAAVGQHPENAPDVSALLLSVVSEKTGYPTDALSLEMSLEGDLGIDSIKRVEILSAVQERAPNLPEVDAGAMAQLQTLGQIVGHMQEQSANFSKAEASNDVSAELQSPNAEINVSEAVGRYRLEIEAMPATGLSSPSLFEASIHVLAADVRLKADLEIALQRVHLQVTPDIQSADLLIDLRPLQTFEDPTQAQNSALELLKSVQQLIQPPKGLVAAIDLGGTFGMELNTIEPALAAGVSGVVKTAAQEWDNACCRVIDIACNGRSRTAIADLIVRELMTGGVQLEVGYPETGKRVVPLLMEAPLNLESVILNANDVCVVSGGGRGVTAETMIALAGQSQAKFALLGRTPLDDDPCPGAVDFPAVLSFVINQAKQSGSPLAPKAARQKANRVLAQREIRQTLSRIEAAGGAAIYRTVNVTDQASVIAVCEQIRAELGPITALVHGAGVLADKRILDKKPADFEWVYGVKVMGARHLLEATKGDSLRWICFFSSVAARAGNQGQSDYAAANESLNKLAWMLQNTRPDAKVKALGWGPWEGGMVTPALKAHFESRGVPLISLAGGANALCLECQGDDAVELVLGGAENLSEAHSRQSFSIYLHEQLQPELLDHQIQGTVVLPMAMVLEYFVQAVRAFRPSAFVKAIHQFRVLKGVKLTEFSTTGQRFQIDVLQSEQSRVSLRLLDGQVPLYEAEAELSMVIPDSLPFDLPEVNGDDFDFSYGESLFHGPRFQMLEQIVHSDTGYRADLSGAHVLGWHEHAFACDPVGVDAALQLALMWREQSHQQSSVPMQIDRVEFGANTVSAASRCVFSLDEGTHSRQQLGSAYLFAGNGRCTLALHGIKTIVYAPGVSS